MKGRAVTPGDPGRPVIDPGNPPPPPGGSGSGGAPIPAAAPTRQTYRAPRDITVNQSAAGTERDIPLGRCLQGTKWLYAKAHGPGGTYFYGVAAIGEGPIRKCRPRADRVYLTLMSGTETNPQAARYETANGKVKVWVYDGSQANGTQETASLLSSWDPTFDTTGDAWDSLAFCVIQVIFDPEQQTSIPDFTFDLEGYRDLYDPRTSTRGYSENRVLWVREVLTNARWGRNVPAASIDDAVTFSESADDCDVLIFPANPTAAPTVALVNTAGNLSGSYIWGYTNANANGVETLLSPASSILAVASKQADVTIPAGDSLTANQHIYRWVPDGGSASWRRVITVAGNGGGTHRDNVSDATALGNALAPTAAPVSQRRYTGGGFLLSRQTYTRDWVNTIRAGCLGDLTWNAGTFEFRVNKALPGGYTPAVFSVFPRAGGARPNVDPDSVTWSRKRKHEMPNEVEVRYTDVQNDFAPGSVVKQRPGVVSGAELPRRAVYYLADVPDSTFAGRLATQLLNLAWDDVDVSFKADRSAISVLPRDVVELTGAGLTSQPLRVRRVTGSGEDFVIIGTEYQAGSYSDAIVTADAPLAGSASTGAPLPTDTPDTPTSPASAGTLTIGDGLEAVAGGVHVTWSAVAWPYALRYRVTAEQAGGSETVIAEVSGTGPVFVEVRDVSKTIRVYAFVAATLALSAALSGTAQPAPPYDVIAPSVDLTTNVLSWTAPQVLSDTTYGASFWSGSGLSALTASAVNNGDKTVDAVTFGASGSQLIFDYGAGNSVPFRQARLSSTTASISQSGLGNTTYIVKYGNTLGSLTAVTVTGRNVIGATAVFGNKQEAIVTWAAIPAGNRYLVIEAGAAAGASLAEVQLYEWLGVDPNFAGVNVYDVRSGTPQAYATVLSTAAPSINITPIISATANTHVVLVHLYAVNGAGEESATAVTYRASVVESSTTLGFVDQTTAQTLENKTLALAANSVTGTKAEFNAACSDEDFVFQADVTELAQDAVGAMVVDTATIDVTYTDATPEIKWDVKDGSVSDAKLRNSAATSVIGRSANSTGAPADIQATADNQVFQRIAGALGWTATPTLTGLGIGAAPDSGYPLDVRTTGATGARFCSIVGGSKFGLEFTWVDATVGQRLLSYDRTGNAWKPVTLEGYNLAWSPVGQAPSYGGGIGVMFIGEHNTTPTSNPTGGTLMWSQSGALKARGTSGTVTTMAPADPHCPVCGGDFVQEQYNAAAGRYVSVCFECLSNFIREMNGGKLPPWIIQRGADKRPNRPPAEVEAAKADREAKADRVLAGEGGKVGEITGRPKGGGGDLPKKEDQ